MKLLPYISTFIKDAAKAVKRIRLTDFIKDGGEVLTNLLGFTTILVQMHLILREGVHEVLHLWCAHREDIAFCTRCGAISTTIHQEKPRSIRHLDMWGRKTILHFLSRRFSCNECGCTFTEELPFVDSHRRQSIDFEMHVYQSCLASNRKAVAIREGLSQSAVKDIFNYYAAIKRMPAVSQRTRVLGIDELSIKKRHKQFVLVISDIDRKCILAVLPNREKKTLENWFDTLKPKEKKAIRFVSIDMWAPYCQAARNKVPHAKVVVDRFHVMKQLNARLTQLRAKYQRESTPEIKAALKGSRWILVRNRTELSKSQADQLDSILKMCPELRELYLLKEEFRAIFEKIHHREKAVRFFDAWIIKAELTGNKFLAKFVNTLKNWREEILNYFIEGITNGFVEGLNNGLRTIIRVAYGYRNFENFRLRILAQYGGFHANTG